jgi:hypothetical protein
MNIFKVIASGKKTFFEEQMSAVLAWFLHPQMEHGLGFEFLNRFIHGIAKQHIALRDIEQELRNRLRGDNVSRVGLELEEYVQGKNGNAFIDVLLFANSWIIGIENKIYPGSAADITQLNREYQGLIAKYPDNNISFVFLVPSDADEILPALVQQEYDRFDQKELRENDFIQIMTWQHNTMGYPSISAIVEGILRDESVGKIEPISEYTRHTLKAWIAFIHNGFAGYDYERINEQSGLSHIKLKADAIARKETGYVGVRGGLTGLLRINRHDFSSRSYQFSESDMSNRNQWLSVDAFKAIYKWRVQGLAPNVSWDAKLPSDLIYQIVFACCPEQSIFVGIKGGSNALKQMSTETISEKSWSIISTDTAPNSQWIPGDLFRRILTSKGLWQTEYPDENKGVLVAKNIVNRVLTRYGQRYDLSVCDTQPCTEQYNCITLLMRSGETKIHLFHFNIGGRLHLFHDTEDNDLSKNTQPLEFESVTPEQEEEVFSSICRHVFREGI